MINFGPRNYQNSILKKVQQFCSIILDYFNAFSSCAKLLSSLLNIVQTFSIQQNDRNSHIYIRVMKQHMP